MARHYSHFDAFLTAIAKPNSVYFSAGLYSFRPLVFSYHTSCLGVVVVDDVAYLLIRSVGMKCQVERFGRASCGLLRNIWTPNSLNC